MELNQKINDLESQLRLLKGEVKETLLDIRETILSYQNPFVTAEPPPAPVLVVKTETTTEKTTVTQPEEPPAEEKEPDQERSQEPDVQPESGSAAQESGTPAKTHNPVYEKRSLPVQQPSVQQNEHRDGVLDLAVIAGLARWVSSAINRIGKKRIDSIVEIYQMTGHLPPGFQKALFQLICLAEGQEPSGQVTMKECIVVLLQLDSLLDRANTSDNALFALLLDDEEEIYHR